jgi:DNA-binding response OmpR family regulator
MTARRSTALVVEDDPKLQSAMSAQLRQMALDVLVANHYDAAVRHLAAGEPDVICIDVGLPNKSGYELCEHIRGSLLFVGLPILMTSDHGDAGEMAYAENAGANAFLHKPFSMRQLAQCIESLLNVSRAAPLPSSELQVQVSGALRVATRGYAGAPEVKRPTQRAYRVLCGVGPSRVRSSLPLRPEQESSTNSH